MTERTSPSPPDDDDDLLAGEYVLGTLDLATRTAAERRLRLDPAFAALVAAWEHRFAELNDDFVPVPAPEVLARIEARLFAAQGPAKKGRFGRIFGYALGGVVAAALAAAVLLTTPPPTPAPSMTATLTSEASPLRYTAAVAGDRVTLTRVAGTAAAAGTVHELWLIAGTNAPVSVGLITADTVTLPLPAAAAGYVLAISLEPAGGSPTGVATGPVLAAGALTPL